MHGNKSWRKLNREELQMTAMLIQELLKKVIYLVLLVTALFIAQRKTELPVVKLPMKH